MKKTLPYFLCVILSTVSLAIADETARPLTLTDCYQLALKQSEKLAIQQELITEAEARFGKAFGPGAETRIPMAITVIGGVAFSTILTLFVVPCAYSLFARLEHRRYPVRPEAAPLEAGGAPLPVLDIGR